MKRETLNLIQNILIILIFIFGLFIAYQIILKIFGGSWETEDIVVTLLVLIIGSTFTIVINLAQLKSEHRNLSKQFGCLAKDFKEVRDIVKSRL